MSSIEEGEQITLKKISEPEFILYAKKELSVLFTEAVSQKNHEKFADMLEIINKACELLKMDWYECSKIKSSKRWEAGTYDCFIAEKVDPAG
jgi:predicted house-cleaning noncanonical NTP pyrophosphatase (MazG superfamily)